MHNLKKKFQFGDVVVYREEDCGEIEEWKAVVVGVEPFVLGDSITVVFESGEENVLEAELFELLERPKCFQMENNDH